MFGTALKEYDSYNLKYTIDSKQIPSFVLDVDYKEIVDELWETLITEDEQLDSKIKKTIANVNIGLLEKGTNRRQTSEVFTDFDEASMHIRERGGK